ncbi:MAG: hypothetical protein ACXAAK_07580 [Candidatus Thorarchaeota archaeon]
MKTIKGPEYSDGVINRFLESEINQEGLLSKRNLESLERVHVYGRPFRQITLVSNSKTSYSLIDEDFAGMIDDSDHQFLLWRPRIADLNEESFKVDDKIDPYSGNEDAVNKVLNDHLQQRWEGQEQDEELRGELRTLQADPLSSIAFIVPRSPGGLRREEKLLDQRKTSHAFVLASSLVTNSSPKSVIHSTEIGARVYIETIVAEYRNLDNDETRLLLLETSGTSSLKDAQKAGVALTRICHLYKQCYDRIVESF